MEERKDVDIVMLYGVTIHVEKPVSRWLPDFPLRDGSSRMIERWILFSHNLERDEVRRSL